jgi:hypothetical protein
VDLYIHSPIRFHGVMLTLPYLYKKPRILIKPTASHKGVERMDGVIFVLMYVDLQGFKWVSTSRRLIVQTDDK